MLLSPSSIIKWNGYHIRTGITWLTAWVLITFDIKQTLFNLEGFQFPNWNRGGSTIHDTSQRDKNSMVGTTIGVWICLTTSNECHVHHWHCSAFISKCYKWSLINGIVVLSSQIDYPLIICIWSLSTTMPRTTSSRSFSIVIQNVLLLIVSSLPVPYTLLHPCPCRSLPLPMILFVVQCTY